MEIARGERVREHLARLVVEEPHRAGHLEPLREPRHLAVARAEADHDDPEALEVAQERRGADERVEVLRVTDVARVHDDERVVEPVLGATTALSPRLRRELGRVHPVRDHGRRARPAPLLLEPPLHRLADRDDAVGPPEIEATSLPERADDDRLLEPLDPLGDLREDVLADHEQRHAEAARDDEPDVADDRRVGHAEHEVGPRTAERGERRVAEIGGVVRGAEVDLRALVRRRAHPDDADAVPHLLVRQLVPVEVAGHDRHVVVARECLAELGEELRRRLDARPVVLVEDEDPRAVAAFDRGR